jgi:hypothetical protein
VFDRCPICKVECGNVEPVNMDWKGVKRNLGRACRRCVKTAFERVHLDGGNNPFTRLASKMIDRGTPDPLFGRILMVALVRGSVPA